VRVIFGLDARSGKRDTGFECEYVDQQFHATPKSLFIRGVFKLPS
jgi:hypothetical protein